ncbi:hypothetical protein PIB30_095339 [Stylosanthes scabra]|uniref:Uncharacterized protein n=1 Tax=Stylosanthes scabra TaxID=79078 RepID=A0ABU6SW84_9FABA|nr:hypothetical protein [Stylosanthes scabra]
MGRTPSFSEVFERTHTRKKDRPWVNKSSHDCKEAFEAEKNRLQAERQAIIDAGCPEPSTIDDEAIWLRIFGNRKKGRIYGKGVVPAYSVPHIIGDVDDDDTASGPPDVREQLSQQAKVNRRRFAQVEAVCDEKMRSGGSGSAVFTAMPPPSPPPPPPPPTRSPSPPPELDRATSPSQHDDDPDYV